MVYGFIMIITKLYLVSGFLLSVLLFRRSSVVVSLRSTGIHPFIKGLLFFVIGTFFSN